ncbi:MAG: prolyl oligopeptidase family serine peptidase [Pirellulales bacterium]
MKITIAWLLLLALHSPAHAEDAAPQLVAAKTPDGVSFATLGGKPAKPAPTLFIFSTDDTTSLTSPVYLAAGTILSKQGWLCVSLDLPCHGQQQREGEPGGLEGWRYRIDKSDDPMVEFTARSRNVLDYLIAAGYTDKNRVAVCGTSRGGFSALHFAAADPRVACAVGYAPVTDLAALSEFKGAQRAPLVRQLALTNHADKLAGRAIWITIGATDQRVDTDAAIATARAITAASVAKRLPDRVSLHVLPSPGHTTPEGFAEQSAQWILRTPR